MPTTNICKTLIAEATATLGNDKQALALQSVGRALKTTGNAKANAVKAYADAGVHPSFMVSPNDKRGRLNPDSKSTATPEQYKAQGLLIAAGMSNAPKGLLVETNAELFMYDIEAGQKRIANIKELSSNSGDKAKKKAWSIEAENIDATIKAGSVLKSKVSPELRSLADMLITEYKRREKAKNGSKAANELAAKLKEETGFKSSKVVANTEADKADKDDKKVAVQQCTNAYNALENVSHLDFADKKITAKEYTTLQSLLSKLIEADH
jgi:hypothetical protein